MRLKLILPGLKLSIWPQQFVQMWSQVTQGINLDIWSIYQRREVYPMYVKANSETFSQHVPQQQWFISKHII